MGEMGGVSWESGSSVDRHIKGLEAEVERLRNRFDSCCTCRIAKYGMEESRVTDRYCPLHGDGPQREVERLHALVENVRAECLEKSIMIDKLKAKLAAATAEVLEWKCRAIGGQCKILSLGSACDCTLCKADNRNRELKAEVERLRTELVYEKECNKNNVDMYMGQLAELRARPSADDVLFLRCIKHVSVPQYNKSRIDGCECAACEVEWLRAELVNASVMIKYLQGELEIARSWVGNYHPPSRMEGSHE
jgi:hypothetical protein